MNSLKRKVKKSARKVLVSFLLVTTIMWSLGASMMSLISLAPEAKAAAAVSVTTQGLPTDFPGEKISANSFDMPVLKISVTASQTSQTLNAVTVNFSGTGFDVGDLLALATGGASGVAIYSDTSGDTMYSPGTDTVITLASTPTWSSGSVTMTPATPVALINGTAKIFFVVIQTSGTISNGDQIIATIPANGVVTSDGNGPAANFSSNYLTADTAAVSIMSVSGASGSATLNVRFSKPVRKAGSGFDNIAFVNATNPFVFTDNGGGSKTVTAVTHTAGQDFAMITLSGNLADGDIDGTPSALAAALNAISDMGGVAVGTTPVPISNPLNITTSYIPSTIVSTVYDAATPLVTFAASGGTSPYVWSAGSAGDATMLTNLGLSLNTSTGKLTGTVANIPGSYSVNIKVTDSAVPTPGEWNKFFNINVAPSGGGGVPGITSIIPGGGPKGAASMPVTVTGVNSHFSSSSAVQFLLNGANDTNITVAGIASSSATNLTFNVTINAAAAEGSRDVKIITGSEQVMMPNGFSVFASGGSGLGLLFPGDAATNVQMPPNFSFDPSVNSAINSYRITLNTTSNFSGTTLWDYTFPKPADINNSNNSHCDSFGCNTGYGEGRFMILTPPTPLAPNMTYYWRVRTYTESPSSSITSATPVESTPVRSFTTTSSMSDVVPPNIMHRPVFQAAASTNLNVVARIMDNLATATTTPALTTKIYFCNGIAGNTCTPTYADDSNHNGSILGAGYYKFTIPSGAGGIGAAGTETRYYFEASDGTNTTQFKDMSGNPFRITSVAAGTSNSITGNVKDNNNANLAGAYIFAEGTGFISAQTGADGNFTLGGDKLFAGNYDLIAIKDGYGDPMINGIPAGSTGIQFMLAQGFFGGFGGDTSKPMVKFTGPMDGMNGIPGNDTNFKIFIVFNKEMSQSKFSESGKMLVKKITDFSTNPPTTANIAGSWTYYSANPNLPNVPPESNMAVFSPSEVFGDNQTIIVSVTSNITDTAGNPIQGNQPDGSFTFSFTTGTSFAGTFIGGGQFGQGAYMPPHVRGVMPAPGSFDVPRNSKIVIDFSDPMADDAGSYLLKNNVKLYTIANGIETDVSSSAINAVTLNQTKLSATVVLLSSYNSGIFAASANYRLKVLGGAKAANGMTIAPSGQESNVMFISDFKTGATSDTAAPTIVGSYPNSGDTDVPVNLGAINIGFSKDMDISTITTSTVYLSIGSTAVNGTLEYRGLERQAFFMPKSALNPNTIYTINVTTGAKGLNGVAIAAVARNFTTGAADNAAPSITFMNADDYGIALTFSEPMNAAKATDTLKWATSVVNPATYNLIKYGAVADPQHGTNVSLANATFNYDPASNTVMIEGLDLKSFIGQELYLEMDIDGSPVGNTNISKDLSGNQMTSPGNVVRSRIQDSQTTKGALGPMAMGGSAFDMGGGFMPTNFSSDTFGFAPPVDVKPFNMMAGQTTIYGVRLPISRQIPAGGAVVLTFPTGFDVSVAQQDINSPMRGDLNGPGTGAVTFKCQTNVAGGKACPSSGGSTVAGDAAGDTSTKGGLADDGIVVNASARTVTIYLSAATNTEGHDFLSIDVSGVKNSTVPKDFNTSGYTVDIKTKNGETVLESLTSMPFFIQTAGSNTLTGTITAAGATAGTMKVYLGSPMTGPMETTSSVFNAGSATYTFSNLSNGEYMLFTDPSITLGATDYDGKQMPERVWVSGATTYDFAISNSSAGTSVTISIDGPSAELLDIFAGSPTGFKAKQVTLDSNAGAQNFTLSLGDGKWYVGVGPQMPKGPMAGPPPAPNYLPPKPVDVTVSNGAVPPVVESSGTANDGIVAFTLTSSDKTIKGIVKDGAGKVMANAEVYGYSPNGGFGTHTQSDSSGNFTLNVVDGSYVLGSFVPGMPSSKEVPVTVNSNPAKGGHATNYLFIDGSNTGVSPTTAATTFILKVAKPDYTISGKITDGTNVVQGASVYAYRTDGPGHANANTDSSGSYTLYVSAGSWNVGSFLPQYGQLTEQLVTISASNATNINFSPTQTGTFYEVSGRVYKDVTVGGGYNGSDVALQGVFVRLTGNGAFNETATGSDGQYSFKVRQGSGYILKAFAPGIGELPPLASFNVSGAVTGKDFAVTPPSTVTFTLSASVTEAFIDAFSTTGMGAHTEIRNGTVGTMSLSNGDYRINVHIPGASINLTDIAATDVNTTTYDNTKGIVTVNGAEGLTITLPTLRTVSGTVTDGTSNISNAWVEIGNPTAGIHFGTSSDANGAFTLKVANASSGYFVNAMKPGYFGEAATLAVNANVTDGTLASQTLTIVPATITISGQVLIGAAGSIGASNAFIRAEKQGGGFSGTQTDTSGNYILPVNAGTWKIYAVAEGYAETAYASNPIIITSSSATGKDIRLTTTISMNAPKSKPITPSSGGTLEDTTAGIKLTIPANALGTSTSAGNIQAKETNNVRETSSAKPVKKLASGSATYVNAANQVQATDSSGNPITTLNNSVTIEMTYTKAELAATASADDSSINTKTESDKLKMAYWDETTSNWVTLPSAITYKDSNGAVMDSSTSSLTPAGDLSNVTAVLVSAPTTHFSLYAPVSSTNALAPSTPSGLSAAAASSSQIDLTWTQVSGATSYDVYRSASSGGTFARLGSEPTVSSGSTTSYSDTGLSVSTAYYYKITSLNASGESAASSEVSATTQTGGGGIPTGGGSVSQLTGSVIINNNVAQTTSRNVTLQLSSSEAAQMAISNSSDFAGASWETYATSKDWILTEEDGVKTVYAKFKNSSGAVSAVASDSITLSAESIETPETPETPTSVSEPDGTLVRYSNSPKVYVVKNGNQVWVQTQEEFNAAGYKWENVKVITATVKKEVGSVTLLRAEGDHKVYVIHNNKKRHIPSAKAFNDAGYKWEEIKVINVAELGSYADDTSLAEGSLVKSSDSPKVYVIKGGKRAWIPSAEAFNRAGYKWTNIVAVDASTVSGYEETSFEEAAPESGSVIITTKWLRVRSSGTTASKTLSFVKQGEKYSILDQSGNWYKVKTSKGVTGWVSGDYAKQQ